MRLRLGLTWFEAPDFPADGTKNVFTATDLALAFTPVGFAELALAVRATSNANDGALPRVLQSVGDITLAAKLGGFVTDTLALALIGELALVGVVGGGGFEGDATSPALRGVVTADFLRGYGFPARFTFGLGYEWENREALFAGRPGEPGVIEEWGLQSARYDRVMLALGLEVPVIEYASAFVEYHIGTPLQVELTRRGPGSNNFTFEAVPHVITPGLRVFPVPALAVDFAFRYGLSDDVYTGVTATPPWSLIVGLAYTIDPRPEVIERTVEVQAPPPPPPARVAGQVIDATTRRPLPDARVAYPGADRAAQLTDAEGRFGGYTVDGERLRLEASAPGYRPALAEVAITPGAEVVVPFELQPDPAARPGAVEVRVVDAAGAPVAAAVTVGDGGEATAERPYRAELPPGRHVVTATVDGHAPITESVELRAGETTPLRLTLTGAAKKGAPKKPAAAPKPTRDAPRATGPRHDGPRVTVTAKSIRLKRPIRFAAGSAALDADTRATLDALAAALAKVPIRRIRIAAHTDNRGDPAALDRLSNERARNIRAHLTARGVAVARLQARGYGATKPIAPNLTARGRERNDRVEFVVLE
ncbi:MAG: OmpA family protein [Myxococcales bacterium]|nr:OmpA family protein [Myxococcales bacterium]